jgi:hypothetical protein
MNRSTSAARRIAFWALPALLVALLLPAAAAQAKLPTDFWGLVTNEAPKPEAAATLKAGGVESFRVPIPWGAVQPGRGDLPQWDSIDPYIRAGAEAGVSVLPFLLGAPAWVVHSEAVGGGRAPVSLPVQTSSQRAAWREFLRLAVFRYGPGGSFWAENPLLPEHPIRTWQIWNEENYKYFAARPSPSQYGQLVVDSYRDLRSADPGARIVLGGMFARPKGGDTKAAPGRIKRQYLAADFLEQMYKTTPGVRGKFLAVALHPYSHTYRQLGPEIEEVRAALKASRDPGRAIWLTELGWSSGHPSAANGHNKFEKGRAGQARELRGAFGLLRAKAAAWRLKRVYWFSFTDSPGTCNFCDGSGLFGEGLKAKPAWSSYKSFAR